MKLNLKNVLPTPFELISLIVLDILLVFLGNTKQLLEYYGLDSSNQVIRTGAGSAVDNALSKLDSFTVTSSVVTFAIWAVVGVVCFSAVRAIAGVYRNFEFDEELSSNRYVHPSTFTRAKFWKQVWWDFAVLILLVALAGAAVYGFMAFAMPAGLAYSRTFLLGTSLLSIGNLLIGLAIMYAGLAVLDICLRLLTHRRQFTEG